MARDTRQAYLRELDRLWPKMRDAFTKAMNSAHRNVDLQALKAAITSRDVEAALKALNVTPGLLGVLPEAISAAFIGAGKRSVESVVFATRRKPVGRRVIGGFDPGNPVAADWMRENGARLVTEILDAERAKVAAVLREALLAGEGPGAPARALAGRVVQGRRKGGLVGLTADDAEYMRMMREALLSPTGPDTPVRGAKKFWIGRDGKLKSAYSARNRRFDGMIKRAIEAGKPLNEDDAARALDGFRNKLLKNRGENIARTEIAAAQTAGQDRAYAQMLEDGQITAVDYVWDATGDSKTRPSHAAAEGQTVEHGQPFTVGGYPMMGPGDGSLGAPASETVRCRCWKRPKVRLP